MREIDMTSTPLAQPAKATLIRAYESEYSERLTIPKGAVVTILERESEWPGWVWCETKTGEQRWVATAYLEVDGNNGQLNQDYEATELSAQTGEIVLAIYEESGWVWCEAEDNKKGWLPISYLEFS